jgi:bifunctional non-homologous end joining protein LigD
VNTPVTREKIKIIKAGGRTIEISSPRKVLFPKDGITKLELAEYYKKIAPVMLSYMKNRPISMQRFPDGIRGERFYQKEVPDYFPSWVERVRVKVSGTEKSQEQVVVNDGATLVYLANQATITPHTWLSRKGKLDYPDKLVVDFDPSPAAPLADVRKGVRKAKELFDELGLASYLMTTGSRGYHVVVSLKGKENFDTVREFAEELATYLCEHNKSFLTTAQRKAKRGKRVYIDVARNAYAQTSVPPYAVRARDGAPVATPLSWEELSRVRPNQFTIKTIFRRLSTKKDPWKDFARKTVSISTAKERFQKLSQSKDR